MRQIYHKIASKVQLKANDLRQFVDTMRPFELSLSRLASSWTKLEILKSFEVELFPTCSAPIYGDGNIDPDNRPDITSC